MQITIKMSGNTVTLTHGDVGQLVSGAVGVDAVEVRTVTVHSTKNQSSPDVALIPENTQTARVTPFKPTVKLLWLKSLIFFSLTKYYTAFHLRLLTHYPDFILMGQSILDKLKTCKYAGFS